MNEKQLEQLNSKFEELGGVFVKGKADAKEVADIFAIVLDELKNIKDEIDLKISRNEQLTENEIISIKDYLTQLEDKIKDTIAEKDKIRVGDNQMLRGELLGEIELIKERIPTIPSLEPLEQRIKEVENKIPTIPEIPQPDSPDEVVKKVNSAKELIDYSKIKNLPAPQVIYKGFGGGSGIKKINAGTGITVSDTGNGEVTLTSTGGTGAVDSVNGQTGVVVLDADDIDDTSTTHKFATGSNTGDVTLAGQDFLSITNQVITANPINLDNLSATGTPSGSTFLRGDNTWATPAGGGGGITRSVNTISTATTAGATAVTDYVYFVSGTTTLTMPTAVSNTNRYTVKNVGVATVTVDGDGAETIDGTATIEIAPEDSVDLISNGTEWKVV